SPFSKNVTFVVIKNESPISHDPFSVLQLQTTARGLLHRLNKKASIPLRDNRKSRWLGSKLSSSFPPPKNVLRSLVWPQVMLEAVSMMGEACYNGTNITCRRAVKQVRFQLGLNYERPFNPILITACGVLLWSD